MRAYLGRSLPLFGLLVATWLLLQGEVTTANLIGGGLVAAGILAIFPTQTDHLAHRIRPWALVRFLVFVLYSLVLSSWAVIKTIVNPSPSALRSGIVRIRLETESPLTTTVVANAVTLTPGTMTLTARVAPAELHIHVLGLGDLDEFRESMEDLERRTVAAFVPSHRDHDQDAAS
jgi:multicomponent Na+:H+ antiporter subunit E